MTMSLLILCLLGSPGAELSALLGSDDPPTQPAARNTSDRPLVEQFAALKQRFEAREKAFGDELRAANHLAGDARQMKITTANQDFQRDWHTMADEVRGLIRAHPADRAAFEGIILLPGLMRTFLDPDIVAIVRAHFLDDPRMGRLCESLHYRTEDWSQEILQHVASKHPDRKVRGQATYALGVLSRNLPQHMIAGRQRAESEQGHDLADAAKSFTRVMTDYADVTSVDGSYKLADKAKAELVRIANLPNLKVGKVAPEITGEDLDGKPLRLSDHRGKVVVVCFWATWCGPCMAMVPHERELVKRMAGKPFALLGVNSDEAGDREKARKAVREKQMAWPSWWDGGSRGAIQTAYDVDHWPTVYVLDPKGVIRYFDVRGKKLDEAVNTLLAEVKPVVHSDRR
jgi:thiol-disulfide isomerase/thioredoxin